MKYDFKNLTLQKAPTVSIDSKGKIVKNISAENVMGAYVSKKVSNPRFQFKFLQTDYN